MTWSLNASGHVEADGEDQLKETLRTAVQEAGAHTATLQWSMGEDQRTINLLRDDEGAAETAPEPATDDPEAAEAGTEATDDPEAAGAT